MGWLFSNNKDKYSNHFNFSNDNLNSGHLQKISISLFPEFNFKTHIPKRVEIHVKAGDLATIKKVVIPGKELNQRKNAALTSYAKRTYYFDACSAAFEGKSDASVNAMFSIEPFASNILESFLSNIYCYKNHRDLLNHIEEALNVLSTVDKDAEKIMDLLKDQAPSLTSLCVDKIKFFNQSAPEANKIKIDHLPAKLKERFTV